MSTFRLTRRTLAGAAVPVAIAGLVGFGAVSAQSQTSTPAASPAASPVAFTLINLNTATEDELKTIPGMGDRMVHEFEEYRPYTSIVQFRKEIGKYVDDAQVAAYEAYVYVPIDVNEADAETLMQLPGVDEEIAQQLIDGRDYAGNQAFLDALAPLVSPADAALAPFYLAEESQASTAG